MRLNQLLLADQVRVMAQRVARETTFAAHEAWDWSYRQSSVLLDIRVPLTLDQAETLLRRHLMYCAISGANYVWGQDYELGGEAP